MPPLLVKLDELFKPSNHLAGYISQLSAKWNHENPRIAIKTFRAALASRLKLPSGSTPRRAVQRWLSSAETEWRKHHANPGTLMIHQRPDVPSLLEIPCKHSAFRWSWCRLVHSRVSTVSANLRETGYLPCDFAHICPVCDRCAAGRGNHRGIASGVLGAGACGTAVAFAACGVF